jgi:hypothetical protein
MRSQCTENGDESTLSTLQLETVMFVGQRHESALYYICFLPSMLMYKSTSAFLADGTRAGYLCGDGTGVGKGRQIAAIIADNFFKGRRKALWFSASASLFQDAKRGMSCTLVCFAHAGPIDLEDIGCGKQTNTWKKNPYYIPIFTVPERPTQKITEGHGVLFVTYSMLRSKRCVPFTDDMLL